MDTGHLTNRRHQRRIKRARLDQKWFTLCTVVVGKYPHMRLLAYVPVFILSLTAIPWLEDLAQRACPLRYLAVSDKMARFYLMDSYIDLDENVGELRPVLREMKTGSIMVRGEIDGRPILMCKSCAMEIGELWRSLRSDEG